MEKRKFSVIRNILLCTLVALACILVYPLHKKIKNYAQMSAVKFKTQMEEEIGLKISYEKLSPSILSTLFVSGISVNNLDNEKILTINKTKVSFKLFKLLRGDFQRGFDSITIDGVDVDVSELVDFIKYISERFEKNRNKEFNLENLTSLIPQNIKLKNISVSYANTELSASVFFKEIGIDNYAKRDSLNLTLVSMLNLNLFAAKKNISCNLDSSGTLFKNLDNSNLSLKIQNLTEGNYRLNKLAMLLTYTDKIVDVHTVQSTNPISIDAQYNFESQKATARVRTETFSPVKLVTALNSESSKQLKLFKDFLIDTDTSASLDLKNPKKLDFNYSSKGYVYVPDVLFPKGITLDYSIKGDEEKIEIEKLKANGPNCNLSAQLALLFKNLQANGYIDLPYFILDNGNVISTEVYVDSLNKGFMIFSPQVFVGNKALTAIQLSVIPEKDSYDFIFEASDYSHFENGEPGVIKLDGSYLIKSKYLQASASLESLYADSILDFGIEAVPLKLKQTLENIKGFASPYGISADAYFSTNFNTFSFNLPYILIANTQGQNQVLMLSANGNNDSIQLNQLSLVYGKFATSASASLDINSETKDMFYTVDFNSSSIPYHFSGSVMKEIITLSGDYLTEGEVRIGKNKSLSGYMGFENLPFSYGNQSFVFTVDSSFTFDKENGPNVNINRFSLEALDTKHSITPKINAAGNINKYGAQLTTVGYTDFYSSLVGTADVTLNINNEIFDSAGLFINLKNPLSDESIVLDANVSNPDYVVLNKETIMNSLYLNAQLQINNLSLNRISNANNAANLLTASLAATGTLEHPFVSLNLEEANILMGSNFLSFNGSAVLDDNTVSVSDFQVMFAALKFTDIQAFATLDDMKIDASCNFGMGKKDNVLEIPIELKVHDAEMGKKFKMPESFVLDANAKKVSGSMIKKPFSFGLTLLYNNKNFTLLSTENVGWTGTLNGRVLDSTIKNNFSDLKFYGRFDGHNTLLDFTEANIDLQKVFDNINLDNFVQVRRGVAVGDFAIRGRLDDPDLDGFVVVQNPVAKVPFLFDKEVSAPSVVIQANSNEIHLMEATYKLNNVDKLTGGLDINFNKGSLNQINARLKSYKKELVPMNVKLPWFNVVGDFTCNLKLNVSRDDRIFDLEGKAFSENLNVTSNVYSVASNVNDDDNGRDPMNVIINLDCTLGTHASVSFDPLLRCVFVPNTNVKIQMETAANLYNIDGQFNLRAGDIAYLNRNFYIKSGSIKLNPRELSNPQVTFTAETRERDSKGQNIRIMLSAENQYLLNLQPKISSNPPKSELEIQTLLGQIVSADSENASNFLVAAGDYAVQSLIFRQTENKLRDLLNFDIFSLRTNVLQNALNMSLASNPNQNYSFGNLFDNSTVYIGKYLGSSLYFDAMLEFNFNNGIGGGLPGMGGLVLQPEIGLELESPFGNIRWNYAPDLEALKNNQYVPASSVTLMWKFTF